MTLNNYLQHTAFCRVLILCQDPFMSSSLLDDFQVVEYLRSFNKKRWLFDYSVYDQLVAFCRNNSTVEGNVHFT